MEKMLRRTLLPLLATPMTCLYDSPKGFTESQSFTYASYDAVSTVYADNLAACELDEQELGI